MNRALIAVIALFTLLFLTGCNDPAVVEDSGDSPHPGGWAQAGSPEFHALTVAAEGYAGCAECHGADYRGGTAGVSCYQCHDGPGGGGGSSPHPEGWALPTAHGAEVAANSAASCTACHGADYRGGTSGQSCYECHDGPGGHPVNWSRESSHGDFAEHNGTTSCQTCHGADYRGGWSEVSCYRCHGGPNP